ncbi:MAG: DNA alkylation repair protein, partial [Eubacterium sp.]|nr:DNA alkylation repair protein [Eubacterium sp.]
CVCSSLKFINKNKADFLEYLKKYMNSANEYDVRFAIVVLMDYYIDDEYSDFAINYFKNINSEYYYVNMAAAWALSVAFVKYREKVLPLIENNVLTKEIHNMTISKIRDSFRVDKETKNYLKTLRIS